MLLRKLYSEPSGLLNLYTNSDSVSFREGINFVYGKKIQTGASLNSIGKSSLLDLIDFCLLSSVSKDSRLGSAREAGIFDGYKIVLEFEVSDRIYVIKRSFSLGQVEFGEKANIQVYDSKTELQPILFDLIFKDDNYKGVQHFEWFRNLIAFFLKIQRVKTERFTDPIKYSSYFRPSEVNQYHLYFLGIDNTLVCENYQVQEQLRNKGDVMKEVERIVRETYHLKIPEATIQINRIQREIDELQLSLQAFHLSEYYENAEKQANQLTAQIKGLWYANHLDRKKLEAYQESLSEDDFQISTRKIANLYKEFSEVFAQNVRRTLDDAIEFRKRLVQSRQDFLSHEIAILQSRIQERNSQIEILEQQRAVLFRILSESEAISDLTNVFYEIGQKQKSLSELEGQIKLYRDISRETAALQTKESLLVEQLIDFVESIGGSIDEFYKIFSEIYESIFPVSTDQPRFGVGINQKSEAKLQIEITFAGDQGQGRNQSRTLVYDLAVLFHGIQKGFHLPHFLVHDGIFNGMDKAHFVAVYEFIERQLNLLRNKGKKFQYIVTLNEEGTLSEKFGHSDKVTPERIEQEAVAVLSPATKLYGRDF